MNLTNRLSSSILFTFLLATASGVATAQHGHSDIEVSVEDGQIVIENGILMNNGALLFESEFGELGSPYGTDDPGFEVDDGIFSANQILGFELTAALQFWDGSQWTAPVGNESIEVIDALSNSYFISGTGYTVGGGIVDAADAEGGIHSHVEFEIGADGNTPTPGAYLVEMALLGLESDQTTEAYLASDSFFIAFNLGLDEAAFEQSIDAISEVPVPAALPLMLSALAGLFAFARRRNVQS